jgi:hypothetical protein
VAVIRRSTPCARGLLTLTALISSVALGLVLAGAANGATLNCRRAYYRYTEWGYVGGRYKKTHQYVEASHIRVQHLGCRRARRLAHDFAKAYRSNYGHPRHLDGFTCRWTRLGSDVGKARCHTGQRVVRFDIYDSSPFH